MEKPESLELQAEVPADVARVTGFTQWDDGEMEKYFNSMGFAMTLSDLQFCRDYFRDQEHRDPHRHRAAGHRHLLERPLPPHHLPHQAQFHPGGGRPPAGGGGEGPGGLLRPAGGAVPGEGQACLPDGHGHHRRKYLRKKGLVPDLDESEEINACSIEAPVTIDGKTETWLIQFKNETHNHPTEIEPFGGAATCLGGAIRGPPCPAGPTCTRRCGSPAAATPPCPLRRPFTASCPPGRSPPGRPQGYSSYGNQIGLGHRPGHRAVRPRLRCQAPGDRRGGGGPLPRPTSAGKPLSPGT